LTVGPCGETGYRRKESIPVITFILLSIVALFVLAGVVTINDGVRGRL
jgi:hypothetical protein